MLIRHIEQADRAHWDKLYLGYAAHYQVEMDMPRRDSLFAWLLDPGHVCGGLVAETDDGLVWLAHYRSMPSPLRGAEVGFLDDLFVNPKRRGLGAGDALLLAVDGIAVEQGWSVVRWITRDNNYWARGLYDRLLDRSDWITYEMTAASMGRA